MRISDWSSDVCSSDLTAQKAFFVTRCERGKQISCEERPWRCASSNQSSVAPQQLHPILSSADRKSVVYGKSVSVRVDLGGRRIIKKKKMYTYREQVSNSKKDGVSRQT